MRSSLSPLLLLSLSHESYNADGPALAVKLSKSACIPNLRSLLFVALLSPFLLSFFSSLFMFDDWNPLGWTRRPMPPQHSYTGNRRNLCMGCLRPLRQFDPQFCCHFCDTGFSLGDKSFCPCYSRYHPACLRIGLPFQSRLQGTKGLRCPPGTEV
jgi:hypothetical protein